MMNSQIAHRLYDLGMTAERLRRSAEEVQNTGKRVVDDIADGYAWKRPVDTNSFMEMIRLQKELEMRESLAIAHGATEDEVRGTYAHVEAGDLMSWLTDQFDND